MTKKSLFKHFSKTASANPESPNPDWQYVIWWCGKCLHAGDTYFLYQKFSKAVASFRARKGIKIKRGHKKLSGNMTGSVT